MNYRKKRCANPACRKVFAYVPGETVRCPWCGDASRRTDGYQAIDRYMRTFRFGVSTVPALPKGRYMVRLERLAAPKKLLAIKAYRAAFAGETPGLRESKMVVDGVGEGRPHVMTGLTADQVMNLMREGQMDLSYRLNGRRPRANHV